MKNTTTHSAIVALFAGIVLCCAARCFAGEAESRFSLGYGSLTQVPADIKSPADAKAPLSGLLTAQYGFGMAQEFKPYLGTGLSYSIPQDTKPGDSLRIKTGLAGQAGFSYLLGGNSTLKFDYKILTPTPDAARDSKSTPQSLGVGVDIKF